MSIRRSSKKSSEIVLLNCERRDWVVHAEDTRTVLVVPRLAPESTKPVFPREVPGCISIAIKGDALARLNSPNCYLPRGGSRCAPE
jgi:hypothetical protein